MESKIIIEVQDPFMGRCFYSQVIPSIYAEHFEPMRTCNIDYLAFGGIAKNSSREKIIISQRKGAAKELGEAISKMILEAMEANDTHNGYLVHGEKS